MDLDDRTRDVLRLVGVQLAVVSAAVHVWWGFPRLLVYAQAGTFPDPRPVLFLVSAAAILAGVVALVAGVRERPLYAAGIAVLSAYSLGYVAWHLGDHGGFLPGLTGATHTEPVLPVLVAHLADPADAVSMAAQLGAIVCFALLLAADGNR
jgi:hypothetical protein